MPGWLFLAFQDIGKDSERFVGCRGLSLFIRGSRCIGVSYMMSLVLIIVTVETQ